MVGLSGDGARFVALDGNGFGAEVNDLVVLVAFNKPAPADEGEFRHEAKRELVDCSKNEIALEGEGFYDDQGRQVLSRAFDKMRKPFEPIDSETALVCNQQHFEQPQVTGFRAALIPTQTTIARVFRSH